MKSGCKGLARHEQVGNPAGAGTTGSVCFVMTIVPGAEEPPSYSPLRKPALYRGGRIVRCKNATSAYQHGVRDFFSGAGDFYDWRDAVLWRPPAKERWRCHKAASTLQFHPCAISVR